MVSLNYVNLGESLPLSRFSLSPIDNRESLLCIILNCLVIAEITIKIYRYKSIVVGFLDDGFNKHYTEI